MFYLISQLQEQGLPAIVALSTDELPQNWLAGTSHGFIMYQRSTPLPPWEEGVAYQQLCSCHKLLRKWLSTAHLLDTNDWQSRFTGRNNYNYKETRYFIIRTGAKEFVKFVPKNNSEIYLIQYISLLVIIDYFFNILPFVLSFFSSAGQKGERWFLLVI